MKIYGGLEGGASFSSVSLVKEDGTVLSCVDGGPSTNYWLIGTEECQNRVAEMVKLAFEKAHLPSDTTLESLGLCLSGCEIDESNKAFARSFIERFPKMTRSCVVASDTVGSVLSVSPDGGVVVISGTGSNCLVYNPDGSTARCGGWGHVIGDEGSAHWIAHRAVKTLFNTMENFNPSPHPIERVKDVVFEHLKVTNLFELFEWVHAKFNKTHYASMTAKLAQLAIKENDQLCQQIFHEAGYDLAKHVCAVLPKVSKELYEVEGGLPIVCVGSVWKSWSLLKKGFFSGIGGSLDEFTMRRPLNSASFGAALLAARHVNHPLPINSKENSQVLVRYKIHTNGVA